MGIACSQDFHTYEECREVVIGLIRENIDRAFEKPFSSNLGAESGRMSPQEQIFHESAGWRNLETSVKCIQAMINGCGNQFRPYVDQELLDLIFTTLRHENRFVRETGYQTCAAIIESCNIPSDDENPVRKFAVQFSRQLAIGLADNWSQVRMAATTATRQFLLCLKHFESNPEIVSILLPRLCLNRYYLAEGVRIYSQDTWVMVVGKNGKLVVEDNIGSYVSYYKDCTKADNHAVREAACQCIAELAAKINPDILSIYVDVILR